MYIAGIVRTNLDGGALRQRGQSPQLVGPHHLVGDQHITDTAVDHRLGFADFLATHTDRAERQLAVRNFRALVTLRMWSQLDIATGERRRQQAQITLKGVEIEDQTGRIDFGKRHANCGGGTKTHGWASLNS